MINPSIIILTGFFLFHLHNLARLKPHSLFDGKTFSGWQGDTTTMWRIEKGTLIGGSLKETVPHNDFLATTKSYRNFDLVLQFKLQGTGFVNAGIQFHSQRLTNPPYEMIGYQADLGDGYWASLYDESRRKVTLAKADSLTIKRVLKRNSWNNYRVRSENRRIQIWLNGTQTVNYLEPDEKIEQSGRIALQIHGGGKAEVSYRNIRLTVLEDK